MMGAAGAFDPAEEQLRSGLRPSQWSVAGRIWSSVAGAVAVAVVLFLATYNIEFFPTTWFDEGSHLHVPKALVEYGVYADTSSEGFRYFGPTTGLGPTVMIPVAVAFEVAGVGLMQARTVMVIYLLCTLGVFFIAARRIYGSATAWIALLLLVSAPGIDTLTLGRQVLGEVPALGFFMGGVVLWWRGSRVDSPAAMGWAGLAFGLAALTKSQYALVLGLALTVLLLVDHFYYRQLSFLHHAIPIALVVGAVGAGCVIPLAPLLGSNDLAHALVLWREAAGGAIFVFSPPRMLSSLDFLSGSEAVAFWAVPSLVYGLVLARSRDADGLRQALLLAFALTGLIWYAFGSIGWVRYSFPAMAVATIFVGRLFRDLLLDQACAAGQGSALAKGRFAAILLGLILIVGNPLVNYGRDMVSADDQSPQETAAYLDAVVPDQAIVETWEPELGFLSSRIYHYPPLGWLDRSVRAKWLAPDRQLDGYDPTTDVEVAYLVVGRFAKYSGIYSTMLSRGEAELLVSIADYDVYHLKQTIH